MGSIRILPTHLINRIAAGEVVERPASVVKELVENSIDAGATAISVEIEQGGRNLISVTDNGGGMDKDEIPLAVERHATSKLENEDLFDIAFFGFRGEALPSIASVSRMTITSKKSGNSDSWSLKIEGGDKHAVSPASINTGTRVEIRDLFFATPARLKFLKTEKTEQQHIINILEQLAMAHPEIAFSLVSDGRNIMKLAARADDHLGRIGDIIGDDFTENALPISVTREDISITGFAGLPTFNRGTTAAQYLFVNGRR